MLESLIINSANHQNQKSKRRTIYHWWRWQFSNYSATVLEYMNSLDILAILGQHITCMHSFWCRCMCLVRVAVSHGYAGPPSAPPHLIPALLPPTTTIIKRRGVWGVVDLGAASPLYRLLVRDTSVGTTRLAKHSPSGVQLVSLKKHSPHIITSYNKMFLLLMQSCTTSIQPKRNSS